MKRIVIVIGLAVLGVLGLIGGIRFLSWRSERQVVAIVSELSAGEPLAAAMARLGPPMRETTDVEQMGIWLPETEPEVFRGAVLYFFAHYGPPFRYVLVVADAASQTIRYAEWQSM